MTYLRAHFFVGPTGFALPEIATVSEDAEVHIHPPIKRFDLPELCATSEPGVAVIVDGVFHSHPAVGHVEIRDAIDAGWQVWGLSSMGAIRAAEMAGLGIRGFGGVFEMYRDVRHFDDDEVTLLHTEEAPYRPLSEPMIHIRSCLDALERRRLLTSGAHHYLSKHQASLVRRANPLSGSKRAGAYGRAICGAGR